MKAMVTKVWQRCTPCSGTGLVRRTGGDIVHKHNADITYAECPFCRGETGKRIEVRESGQQGKGK